VCVCVLTWAQDSDRRVDSPRCLVANIDGGGAQSRVRQIRKDPESEEKTLEEEYSSRRLSVSKILRSR